MFFEVHIPVAKENTQAFVSFMKWYSPSASHFYDVQNNLKLYD